jgi:hypothetical protein
LSHRYAVDLVQRYAGLIQRVCDDRGDAIEVLTRSKLGHDSTERRVSRNLRSDDVRTNDTAGFDHCRGSFIARALYAKN